MFIPCSEKKGSAYFEFQYCKKDWSIKKLVHKGYDFRKEDSLLVHIDDDEQFFENYLKYLDSPIAPNGTTEFDCCGVNYYTKEQTLSILKKIENDKPPHYEVLVTWLKKSITDFNGFYFLGI